MGNGSIFAGRAIASVNAGRAIGQVAMFPAASVRGGLCSPVPQCCCKGPWYIGPGETQPLGAFWDLWLKSIPGFNLAKVLDASLYDMMLNPPGPADPDIIKLLVGADDDDDEIDNGDVASAIRIVPPTQTTAFVQVGLDARINSQFRLNIALKARNCDGDPAIIRDCIVITVAEC